ncbi:MAG: 2-C-methyl-D-erythritol 4-phosphate cytidylyltransferase [Prevotella sp.]|nr:2-C-methyl-D-erythritol 4-phosphate cytidylyltransferase [Prevotella sp.]
MEYIIIVAGGKGLRMGGDLPKQFLPIGGKPVLMHTIDQFRKYSESINIILVLPREQQDFWRELCKKHHFIVPHTIVDGGKTRFHSSLNGLTAIPDNATGVVGIHDGVRPFVSTDVIAKCYDTARTHGAVIPVLPVTDTLRFVGGDQTTNSHNVLRSDYRIVQTPQVFDIQLIKRAFQQPYSETFTDDASVVEAAGARVAMVDGNRENIKLTTPYDLKIAGSMIKS